MINRKFDKSGGFQKQNGHNGNGRFLKADIAKVAVTLFIGTGLEIPEFGLGIPAQVLESKIGRNVVLGTGQDYRLAMPEARAVAEAIQEVRATFIAQFDRRPGKRVRDKKTGKASPLTAKRYDYLLANCDETLERIRPLMILQGQS